MDDLNVIDAFLKTFVTYIESGFGLLEGDVGWLTSVLVAIDHYARRSLLDAW